MTTPGLFITATDTDAGKTFVTALIARELTAAGIRTGVYKPACSGSIDDADGKPMWQDIEQLWHATRGEFDRDLICPQRFSAALAPPVAAAREGRRVDGDLLRAAARRWDGLVDLLLVEGVGGLLCPLTEEETIADLAGDLGFPLVIVSRLGLGTINHTLLTVEAAQARGLRVAGIVCNEAQSPEDAEALDADRDEIAKRSTVPILAVASFNQTTPLKQFSTGHLIDWQSLAACGK